VLGIGLVARLFADVVAGRAAETARREAAELRAVTLLARGAAHEINTRLTTAPTDPRHQKVQRAIVNA